MVFERRVRQARYTTRMNRIKPLSRCVLGVLFIVAGVNHFANTAMYASIMPPYLPWHVELVYLSGVAEMFFGAMLLPRRYASFAAWGLIALCIAVFPANLHMALHAELYPSLPTWSLWLRLPLQGLLMAWIWCYTKDSKLPE